MPLHTVHGLPYKFGGSAAKGTELKYSPRTPTQNLNDSDNCQFKSILYDGFIEPFKQVANNKQWHLNLLRTLDMSLWLLKFLFPFYKIKKSFYRFSSKSFCQNLF